MKISEENYKIEKRKEYLRSWRKENKEKVREYYKKWLKKKLVENPNFHSERNKRVLELHPDCNRKNYLNYGKYRYCEEKNKEKFKLLHNKTQEKYKKKNPKKIKAQQLAGKIIISDNQLCEDCNTKLAVHRHHEDYNKPLEVNFLCINCHKKRHNKGGKKLDNTTRT